MTILREHIVSKIADPAERRRHGGTAAEAQARGARREELKEQAIFEALLRQKRAEGILNFTHPQSNKPTTIERGQADFMIRAQGRCLSLEFKAPGGRLTEFQEQFLRAEWIAGNPAGVVYSAAEAYDILNLWLNQQPLIEKFLCPT
jgi:hypothetical protein